MTFAQLATAENASLIDPPPNTHDDDDSKTRTVTQVDGASSGRLLFDFSKFLEGGALNNVFGFPPDSADTSRPDSVFRRRKLEVTELSGGLINFTVRVTPRHRDDELEGNPRSVVAKYAPPFVAAIGEDAPFGTFRQVIEYRALSLLSSTPSITSAEAAYGVSIPRVVKFFEDEKVLVIQDLGEWMKPLDSWLYPPTTSTAESPSLEMSNSVGARLGSFLASIHCDPTLLSKSQTLSDGGKPWFENPDAVDFVRDEIVGKTLPILQSWLTEETGRNEKVAEIVSQDFERSFLDAFYSSLSPPPQTSTLSPMFLTGDLWTGSVLVGVPPTSASSSDPGLNAVKGVEVGLIDWEFASPGRIGQDVVQLSAWLHLFSTSSARSSAQPHHRKVSHNILLESGAGPVAERRSTAESLLDALLRTYANKVKGFSDYTWFVDENYDQGRFKEERLAMIRSIWVLFGREVIYNAVESKSMFVRFFSTDPDGDGGEEMMMWQREMVEFGCWYISAAGQSQDEEFEGAVRKERLLKRMYTTS